MDLVTLVLPELSPLLKTIVATLLGYERLSMISEVSMKDWLVETFTDEQMFQIWNLHLEASQCCQGATTNWKQKTSVVVGGELIMLGLRYGKNIQFFDLGV
ncbi:hypothetical protein AAZX31_09G071700 [Glycine max]|uniref:Uncharacterized protein n=2 Tax=Glycine subgen. Soja TaxID=1462606 RepID=K7LCC0_SOYBN|nr:hypothetical protein GYH30_024340 [Glycine max]RZB91076.1 hypothetical protein D0Y65_023463 [Glycine soja]